MNDDVIQLEDEFLENATDVMGKYFASVADEHTRELIHTDFTEILDGVVASGQIEGYMLSETTSQSALNWRQRCRDNAAWQRKREKLADGDVVRFKQVISFTNGHNQDTFAVVIRDPSECGHRRRRTFFKCVDSGFLCRITGYTMRKYQFVSMGGA